MKLNSNTKKVKCPVCGGVAIKTIENGTIKIVCKSRKDCNYVMEKKI